jgi:integrase
MQPGDECGDAKEPGLRIRCLSDGKTKTFFYRYRDDAGALRQIKVGVLGALTLDQARKRVALLKVDRTRGVDPQAEKRARVATAKAERSKRKMKVYTAADVVQDYLNELVDKNRKPKGAAEVRRMLERAISNAGSSPVEGFTRLQAHELIREVAGKAPRLALMIRQELRAAWEHAIDVGRASVNPFLGKSIGAIPNAKKRQRVLSPDEIGALLRWMQEPATYSRTVRDALEVTLRTGMRSGEVCGLHSSELVYRDGILWADIPGERMKADKAHHVPLIGRAREIVLARLQDNGGYLFPSRRVDRPIDQKVLGVEVYASSGRSTAATYKNRKVCPVKDWSPHDLRRTARTFLADLGCPYEVGEAILAHRLPGVAGDYNKARHMQARVEWLAKLGVYLDELMEAKATLALVKRAAGAEL